MGEENDTASVGPPKFVFECRMCGESCRRAHIPVITDDVLGWVRDGTIERVLAFLQVTPLEDAIILELTKGEDGHCSLYHAESGKCSIHYNKPRDCRAFPLGYDVDRYYVRYRDCPGLGKGKMTAEALAEMRESARSSFEGGMGMEALLPVLQAVFYRKVMEDSFRAMENLNDKDRETLEGIMGKSREAEDTDGRAREEDVEEVEIRLDEGEEKDVPSPSVESPDHDDEEDGGEGDRDGDVECDGEGDDKGGGNGEDAEADAANADDGGSSEAD